MSDMYGSGFVRFKISIINIGMDLVLHIVSLRSVLVIFPGTIIGCLQMAHAWTGKQTETLVGMCLKIVYFMKLTAKLTKCDMKLSYLVSVFLGILYSFFTTGFHICRSMLGLSVMRYFLTVELVSCC